MRYSANFVNETLRYVRFIKFSNYLPTYFVLDLYLCNFKGKYDRYYLK